MKNFKKGQRVTVVNPENAQFAEGSGSETKTWFNKDYKTIEWFVFMYGESGNIAVIVNKDNNLYVSLPDEDIAPRLKIYISGPITNVLNGNKEAFEKYEQAYTELGYDVVNPHKLENKKAYQMLDSLLKEEGIYTENEVHAEFMKVDLIEMLSCDVVGLMNEQPWRHSKGCLSEVATAKRAGIKIISLGTQKELDLNIEINVI